MNEEAIGAPLAEFRRRLVLAGLDERAVAADPLTQFQQWFGEAEAARVETPTAMAVATATPDGAPAVRMVLLKGVDARGFVFFTNYESRKGRELAANPRAALLFHWTELGRQVRIAGPVERVTREESVTYFATRPRGSQLGAWASRQSEALPDRATLEAALARYEAEFAGRDVPLPPHWGGFRVLSESVEFWQSRPNRLHDRLRYTRRSDDTWGIERLAP